MAVHTGRVGGVHLGGGLFGTLNYPWDTNRGAHGGTTRSGAGKGGLRPFIKALQCLLLLQVCFAMAVQCKEVGSACLGARRARLGEELQLLRISGNFSLECFFGCEGLRERVSSIFSRWTRYRGGGVAAVRAEAPRGGLRRRVHNILGELLWRRRRSQVFLCRILFAAEEQVVVGRSAQDNFLSSRGDKRGGVFAAFRRWRRLSADGKGKGPRND